MYLYVYEDYKGGAEGQKETEALVLRSLSAYLKEEKQDVGSLSRAIVREDRGKPIFQALPVEFSVSHTKTLWVCAMDNRRVGVDIQILRDGNLEKVMERYYTEDERAYVETAGQEGFFRVWTRKEAYAKYLGTGLTQGLKDFSTLQRSEVDFIDFDIHQGVKGACCARGKRELWIRKLGEQV